MKKKTPRPTYRQAVRWIAAEDEPLILKVSELSGLISVALVADLFGKEAITVARDVARLREHKAQAKKLGGSH